CAPADLARMISPPALVVCDCEGAEIDILCPALVPSLGHCDMIVELHDCFRPGASAEISRRFSSTHHVKIIDAVDRHADLVDPIFASAIRRTHAPSPCLGFSPEEKALL